MSGTELTDSELVAIATELVARLPKDAALLTDSDRLELRLTMDETSARLEPLLRGASSAVARGDARSLVELQARAQPMLRALDDLLQASGRPPLPPTSPEA